MTKKTAAQQGKTNKRKGSDAERFYRAIFEKLGFTHCVTARLGSRLHDNAGIDLINIPFNIQIKAGKQTKLDISKELNNISTKTKKYFPEDASEHNLPSLVIHKKQVGRGKLRTEFDEIVSMTFKDFIEYFVKPIYLSK